MAKTATAEAPSFPPPETDAAKLALDAQIAAQRQRVAEIEGTLAEHRKALSQLEEARKALSRQRRSTRRSRPKVAAVKTAAQRAGRGNMTKARDLLRHNGPTTKAQITRLMQINDGTVTYALRALEETGEVRKTGERVGGSDVYEYVSKTRAITRPGDRR